MVHSYVPMDLVYLRRGSVIRLMTVWEGLMNKTVMVCQYVGLKHWKHIFLLVGINFEKKIK